MSSRTRKQARDAKAYRDVTFDEYFERSKRGERPKPVERRDVASETETERRAAWGDR